RVISEHAKGTNYVTTILEHPSSFDAMTMYAQKNGMELRVAKANPETGGVTAQEVLSLIDENTAILSCMVASNISGYIYDLETICKGAREKNPDIFILCDAVQHAPHGALNPESLGIDGMNFAPYKFFGVRGFALAYLSDRVASFPHHRLLGKAADEWEIGSPATGQYAAVEEIIRYVVSLGEGKTRREQFLSGMRRIAGHERALLFLMLEGTQKAAGLRHLPGVKVQMDGKDLMTRDLILSLEFSHLSCQEAVAAYEQRGIVTFERSLGSIYSKRMLDAFDSQGVVRLSPLHVNTVEEIEHFLLITKEIAAIVN
ncbi:MAG: aminotransferase class V-fold PLP-dependent enzyme, partial [Blautia sp.]|nr:aminotransferase class V-fold PLP-dependent enzyme [Blautia sp.]